MNTQEYIDSGVLELYAAGGLTPAECEEVERMAAQYPDVHTALEECLRTMEAYALTHAKAPRPELEDQILRHLQTVSAQPIHQTAPTAKVVSLPHVETVHETERAGTAWWQIAAVILLLISAAANVYLYSNLQETRQELVSAQQTTRQYALQVNQLENRSLQSESLLGVLRNPKTLAVKLNGVTQHPDAQATVFWNQETKEVYFDGASLPAAPTGKQYQLWALAQGKPIDAGVVKTTDSTLLRMKSIEEAQAFAVTLEPEGGSVNPTLEEMYVMGNSSSK
ncbi:anti-sigma factor domain-containing protein [Rufibacter sediminis]|uniref:Anti-sigma factor n=1 Tax=Rufibacter sediminis TaxID=2762756 RepID=A0ABR6VYW7_9BACT|nr:anti-sigma factor [Rufibacter sediminis]MBC3542145.1 anti-sigma factor [Rufibacter sediminis]